MTKVKFAIPKGHLGDQTQRILERAGYPVTGHDRTYRPGIHDPDIELKVLRPQEIPTFVSEGAQDVGISGRDWVAENNADVETLLDMEYARVRLVFAVPKNWNNVNDLSGLIRQSIENNKTLRVSTEYLNAAKEYIMKNPVYVEAYGEKAPVVVTPWCWLRVISAWWMKPIKSVVPRTILELFIETMKEATN